MCHKVKGPIRKFYTKWEAGRWKSIGLCLRVSDNARSIQASRRGLVNVGGGGGGGVIRVDIQ